MATLRPVKVRAVKLRYTKGKSHTNGNRYRPVRVKVRCAGELEQPPPPPPLTPFLVSICVHHTVGGRKLYVLYHVSCTWDWNEAAILWVSARAWYMYIIKSKWMHCVRYCQLLENNMESIIKWYMYVLPPLFPIFMRGISRDGNDSILWKYNCNAMQWK